MTQSLRTLLIIGTLGLASACAGNDDTHRAHADRHDTAGDEDHHVAASDHDESPERVAEADVDAAEAEVDSAAPMNAADQRNSDADIAITQAIRSAVTRDDTLSVGARNCTIITRDSMVTLRGNVNTEAERATVERHATEVAGVSHIENLLVVSP